jgi:hypothetical protein
MTEIPEHLLKRARARGEATSERGRTSDDSIGEKLTESVDPFERARNAEEKASRRLFEAKVALVTAIRPVRRQLEDAPTILSGQFIDVNELRFAYPFTPAKQDDTAASFTIYGNQEQYIELPGNKSLRLGEEHAWRTLVPKREIGGFLKKTGKRPMRDLLKLVRGNAINAKQNEIKPELVQRVFEDATAERVTNSAVIYEGAADPDSYRASRDRRYGVSATIVRNPASTPEDDGIFGVDLLSFNDRLRIEERTMNDGTRLDRERVGSPELYRRNFSPENVVFGGLEAVTSILRAYGSLLHEPTKQAMHEIFSSTDRVLSGR